MNIKMATNSKLSTTESKKKKLSEQLEQEQNHIMEIIWRVISWKGKNGGKSVQIKKHNWQVQNRQREVKNSIENREAKELICRTHGHEIRGWSAGGNRGTEQRGAKGKYLDNCNSIINKIYLKIKIKHMYLLTHCSLCLFPEYLNFGRRLVFKFVSIEITLKFKKHEKSLFKPQRNTSTDQGFGYYVIMTYE